jgi:hypothetical protein
MEVGAGEEAFYKSFGKFAGALVVFLYNLHKVAGFYVFSVSSVHFCCIKIPYRVQIYPIYLKYKLLSPAGAGQRFVFCFAKEKISMEGLKIGAYGETADMNGDSKSPHPIPG